VRWIVAMLVSSASAIRLSLQPSARHVSLQEDARLGHNLGRTLAFVDQAVELLAFVRAQSHNVSLDGNILRGHESPPSLGRGSDSENSVRFNDISD
jgi:hypothetical protein